MKWKGSLFYRFVTTLVDDDHEIRKFGLYHSSFNELLTLLVLRDTQHQIRNEAFSCQHWHP